MALTRNSYAAVAFGDTYDRGEVNNGNRPNSPRVGSYNMSRDAVPVIDVEPFLVGDERAKQSVARRVDETLRNTGFMSIVGHGVPNQLVQRAREAALEFFGQELAEKMKVANPPEHMSRGYNWVGNRSLAYTLDEETPPDLQEGFAFGPLNIGENDRRETQAIESFFAPNIWPKQPANFRAVFEDYYRCVALLAEKIMGLFAVALDLHESYFNDKIDKPTSVIRVVHYPAQSERPAPGQLRAGVHTDYGTLTILYGDDTPGGLQVKLPSGDWLDVHPTPGALVCNVGDLMARWTNDRWVSNLHRVANPPSEHASVDRIAIPFFHNTNHDALIQCIPSCLGADGVAKYPPVLFSEHYLDKQTKAERKPGLTAGKTDK